MHPDQTQTPSPGLVLVGGVTVLVALAAVVAIYSALVWLVLEPIGGADLDLREALAGGLLLVLIRFRPGASRDR